MTYLIKYVFQIKQKIEIYVLSMWLQEKINQKFQQKIYYKNVNVNLMKENGIQIKSGIMINVNVSVKNIYVKRLYLECWCMYLWKW